MVKLSDRKIRWIVRHCYIERDVSTREAARIYGVSVRRVQQLIKGYKETGEVPVLKKERRPKTYLSNEEKKIIEEVWKEARLGARLLYYELRKRGYKIPLNKIHRYYRETGKSKPKSEETEKAKEMQIRA